MSKANATDSESVASTNFQHLLQHATAGIPLWHPAPSSSAEMGDCGYVEFGRFHKLFNVFDPPDGLPGLPLPARCYRHRATVPNTSVYCSSATSFFGAHGGFPLISGSHAGQQVEVEFDIDHRQRHTAFLLLGGSTHETEELSETRMLQDFLINNELLILRTLARRGVHLNPNAYLVLLHGATKASGGWRGGIVQSETIDVRRSPHDDLEDLETAGISGSIRFSAGVRAGQPEPVVRMHDVAKEHMRNTALTWSFTQGPSSNLAASYCVAIRPVAIRRRNRVLDAPGMISASTPARAPLMPVAVHAHARSQSDVLRRVRSSVIDLRLKARELFVPSHRRTPTVTSSSAMQTATHTPASSTESNGYFEHSEPGTARTSMSEEAEPSRGPSILHGILDAVLADHPNIALAVGDWNVIDRYVDAHKELPGIDCSKSLDILHTGNHGYVAYLLDVAPPVHHTHQLHFESFVTPSAELDSLHAQQFRPHMYRLRDSILKLETRHFTLTEAGKEI